MPQPANNRITSGDLLRIEVEVAAGGTFTIVPIGVGA
uniref:Uncharacterized protein n=1 Tax=Pithovirus LCPAC201 TaxID=2506591 RepID=A0A481Z6G0_9VIRU|nr:MAG: hypothetical protein LCPAC201_02830 [Pithovirus LCPAC201]